MLTKLWRNPEVVGRIYLQACNLFPEGLLPDQKDRFFSHAFSVMHKLSAVDYHLENYRRLETEQAAASAARFRENPDDTEEAFELIFELDAFLVQVKSSLDMLAKLLRPILGEGVVKTATFAQKGEALIKGLRQYQKKGGVSVEATDDLITLIEEHRGAWLQRTVELRDHLNHVEALRDYKFTPTSDSSALDGVQKPRFDDTETLTLMELIRSNNLIFQQDFMVLALALRAFPGLVLVREDSAGGSLGVPQEIGKYVVWGWKFQVPG